MKVHWTDTAEGHLDGLYAYIAQDSPEVAKRMVDQLTRRSQQNAELPFSGRRVPEYNIDQIREVIEGPPGRPVEFHHQSPTDPYVSLSTHTARASLPPEAFQSQAYLARKSSSQFPG